jgi:transcriptional regulator with XRE-family HTH domain
MALTLTLVMAPRKKTADDPRKAVNLALGKRLAQLRTLRNLSQRELADRVGVVQVVVSNYEIGKLRITAEVALRLAAALDVPIQELLQTDTPPEIVQQPKPSRKVLERLEKIQSLPRRKQDAILTTIDHFLNSAAAS